MKTLIIVALFGFLGVSTTQAAIELLKSVKVAEIGTGDQVIFVSKIVDGNVTCYVSRQGKFGSHAISCVK